MPITPPPPNLAAGSLVRLSFEAWCADQLGENTCAWYALSQTGVGMTIREVATSFAASWVGQFKGLFSYLVQMSAVNAEQVDITTNTAIASWLELIAGSVMGTTVQGVAAKQVSLIIRKETALSGRAFRGRCYYPFPLNTWFSGNGEVVPGTTAPLAVQYENMLGELGSPVTITGAGGSLTGFPVIVHKPSLRFPLPLDLVPIVGWFGEDATGTQRRRSDYGRENPNPA